MNLLIMNNDLLNLFKPERLYFLQASNPKVLKDLKDLKDPTPSHS